MHAAGHMPSQRLTEASSHLSGPAPTTVLKCVSAVVCNHCALGAPSSWTVGSELLINHRGNHRQMKEEELRLPEMPGAGREEQVGKNYIEPLRGYTDPTLASVYRITVVNPFLPVSDH